MNRFPRLLLVISLAAAADLTPPAGATEFYVAPDGNDANPGTPSHPFATLQTAVNQLQPGDTRGFMAASIARR